MCVTDVLLELALLLPSSVPPPHPPLFVDYLGFNLPVICCGTVILICLALCLQPFNCCQSNFDHCTLSDSWSCQKFWLDVHSSVCACVCVCVCVSVETGISLVKVWVHRRAAVTAEVRSTENMTALHCSSMDHSMRWLQNVPEFCHHHHFCTANMVLQLYSVWDACSSTLVVGLGNFGLCNYRMLCSKFSICSYPVK